ncbi:hypothetical protein N7516_006486 [Penicillium verrucosum]|uniref:uncharacterized protein n=1 Tax=Penicillium verrucosum TaxID=60171 RepID=UPI00254557F7|nr:uncharacterized protein N7516_006486 [Penicillium verrucosum]KAJ5931997.1 hypothetical protein N7516_006486 [Penicillium verrucosum]
MAFINLVLCIIYSQEKTKVVGPKQLSPRRPEPAHDIIQELPPKLTPILPTSSIPPYLYHHNTLN